MSRPTHLLSRHTTGATPAGRAVITAFLAALLCCLIAAGSASAQCTEEDPDRDGDGFCASEDCDDGDPSVNPGAEEICDGEAVDQDCDGLVGEEDPDCQGCSEENPDRDGDGFCADHDCNDDDPLIHPGATEVCDGRGVDEDCDGHPDDLDPDCFGSGCDEEASRRSWVYFSDKGFSSDRELARALDHFAVGLPERTVSRRRARRAEPGLVDWRDLPLDESYLRAVALTGTRIHAQSRWLNAVSVVASADQLEVLSALPFVSRIEPVRRGRRPDPAERTALESPRAPARGSLADGHGLSEEQLSAINLVALHSAGFTGDGVVIGVLDTGFVTTHAAFSHPQRPLRVLARWDFVNDDPEVGIEEGDPARQHEHGTEVLGTMAAYAPGTYLGGAFDASFILAKTEEVDCERPLEEDNYVAGLEFAELHGADVVTSSLGYIAWYEQADLDGRTAVTTRAVNVATLNGVVCVTAAGNGRNDLDPETSSLLAPADAFRVLSVGAVELTGEMSGLSSDGPTADGRVKPEVLAVGESVATVDSYDDERYVESSGTSLSTPQVTAAVACLLQAHPDWNVDQMRTYIMSSGDVFRRTGGHDPFFVQGFGILDAALAAAGDCDRNGVVDTQDILSGAAVDCDGNQVPDTCDLALGTWRDENGDRVPDVCERTRMVQPLAGRVVLP